MSTTLAPPLKVEANTIGGLAIFVLGIGTFIGDLSLFVAPLIVGDLIAAYGLSEGQVGLIISGRLGVFAAVSIGVATQIHRLDRRLVSFVGAGCIVAANFGSALADTTSMYIASRVLLGTGEGLILTAVTAIAAGSRFPEKTFAALSLWVLVLAILTYLSFPMVLTALGLKGSFLAMAGAVALLACVFFILPAKDARKLDVRSGAPSHGFPWTMMGAGVLVSILLLNVGANSAWFYVERMGDRMGMTHHEVGNMLAIVAILAVVGPLVALQINTRFGRLKPIVAGFLLLGVSAVLMTHTRSPIMYTAAISISSAMLGFCAIYLLGVAAALDKAGRLAAACRGFVAIGNTIAPGLGGGILLLGGTYEVIGWASILAASLAIAAAFAATRFVDGGEENGDAIATPTTNER